MPRWRRKSIDKRNSREISSLSFVHTLAIERRVKRARISKRETREAGGNDSRG